MTSRRPRDTALAWVFASALLSACGSVPGVDVGADADSVAGDIDCQTAPVETWDTFGESFMRAQCQSCHASSVQGDARHGAPVSVAFDDEGAVSRFAPRILATTTGSAPTMPPAGGVVDDDRTRVAIWLTCFAP